MDSQAQQEYGFSFTLNDVMELCPAIISPKWKGLVFASGMDLWHPQLDALGITKWLCSRAWRPTHAHNYHHWLHFLSTRLPPRIIYSSSIIISVLSNATPLRWLCSIGVCLGSWFGAMNTTSYNLERECIKAMSSRWDGLSRTDVKYLHMLSLQSCTHSRVRLRWCHGCFTRRNTCSFDSIAWCTMRHSSEIFFQSIPFSVATYTNDIGARVMPALRIRLCYHAMLRC